MTDVTTNPVNAETAQSSALPQKSISLESLNLIASIKQEPILDWDFVIDGKSILETQTILKQAFANLIARLDYKEEPAFPSATAFCGLKDFPAVEAEYVHQVVNNGVLVSEMVEIKLSNSSFSFLKKMNELEGVFEQLKAFEVMSHILNKPISVRIRFTEAWKSNKRPSGRAMYKGNYFQLAWFAEGLDQGVVFDYETKGSNNSQAQTQSQSKAETSQPQTQTPSGREF